MRDLLTETLGRLVYVTCPLWLVPYFAWRRDWEGVLVAVVWMVPVFVVGVVIHGFWFVYNSIEGLRMKNGHTIIVALFLALAAACGHPKDDVEPGSGYEDGPLSVKRYAYETMLPSVSDPDGFVEFDKCDSVHWSALTAAATRPINIRAVIDGKGKLHRRPPRYEECYPEHSKSENSRDAFLMVLAYALAWQDLPLVEGIFAYGRDHMWKMGEGPASRTQWTGNLIGLYAQAIEHLGGPSHIERLSPILWTKDGEGYEAHLAVVSILAYGKIHGGITEKGYEVLEHHYERQPRNPLYAAAYYRYSGVEDARKSAVASLLDESLWPSDRLPTSAERCEPWLVQRDAEGSGWQPCPEEGRVHGPGDYLFANAVLSGRF